MIDQFVPKIAKAYGLEFSEIRPMQTGYRNKNFPIVLANQKIVNLIIYKCEPNIIQTIKNANYVGDFLAFQGYPARSTFDPRIIRVFGKPNEQYACLYNYLPGSTIPWEAYTMKHLKLLGKYMSDMHFLTKSLPQHNLPNVTDIYLQIISTMEEYFANYGVKTALKTKLGLAINPEVFINFKQIVRGCKNLSNDQPLHMDFVRSNILFSENGELISGVLDFEKSAYGNPIFDIARTLSFLLVDCKYKNEAKIRKYFLQSGYSKRGLAKFIPITIKSRDSNSDNDLLDTLINLFLTYDFYKFLKHNPYESLNQNEHYIRTKDYLLNRGLLTGAHVNMMIKYP